MGTPKSVTARNLPLSHENFTTADLAPGTGFSSPALFRSVNSTLYFTAFTAATGIELWKSDGTATNTLLVKDLTPGSFGSSINSPSVHSGQLYFTLSSSLWVTDGTSDGTISSDTLLDGTQSVTVRATSIGYFEGDRSLDVTDHESLTVTLDTSATFTLTTVDDALLDGTQPVTIRATSSGYIEGNRALDVIDYETLTLTLDNASISEQAGSATGTVSRSNTDRDQPITVQLGSSDTSEATVPASVIIPAGQASATFTLTAVDDTLLDGTQSVTVRATSIGYFEGNRALDVTDHETLTVTLDTASISEQAGSATGTVSRSNTDLDQPITIQLSSSDTSEATVRVSVTIPAGQASGTFTISAVDDTLLDGAQVAVIATAALGYEGSMVEVNITDDDPQFPWQNPRNPLDVNDDGFVTAIDALLIINALNTGFQLPPQLPDPFVPVQYIDVNGNGSVTPLDALLVINELNRPRNPEGEGLALDWNKTIAFDDSVLDLLTEEWLRLRRPSVKYIRP